MSDLQGRGLHQSIMLCQAWDTGYVYAVLGDHARSSPLHGY